MNNEISVNIKLYCFSIVNDFGFLNHIEFMLFYKRFILRIDKNLIVFIF